MNFGLGLGLKTKFKDFFGLSNKCKIQTIIPKINLGTEYGGWTIAPEYINKDSIVYSFGIGEDISFDLELINKFGVNVYAFDPTPKSINWVKSQNVPVNFKMYEYGIADFDGVAQFNPPENPDHVSHTLLDRPSTSNRAISVQVYTLQTIMKMLKHTHIDILKMDIEGAEYPVLRDLINQDIPIKQLLVEFHHSFDNISFKETKQTIELLNLKGYKIFDVSSSGLEYSFIKD